MSDDEWGATSQWDAIADAIDANDASAYAWLRTHPRVRSLGAGTYGEVYQHVSGA